MGEAVEQGGGHLCIAEDRGPFAEAEVGGDDDAGAFVELAQQVEEQGAAGCAERQVSQFVQHHEVEARQTLRDLPGEPRRVCRSEPRRVCRRLQLLSSNCVSGRGLPIRRPGLRHRIENYQQLAGAGHDDQLSRFSNCDEALFEGPEDGIEPAGGEGCEIEAPA